MALSPQGPLYAGSATQTGSNVSWTNITRATGAPDSSYATCGPVGPGGGGGFPNEALLTNFGFSLPSYAIIDGIQVIVYNAATGVGNTPNLSLMYNGNAIGSTPSGSGSWNGTPVTYGSSTSAWGGTLTPAIVNDSSFGVQTATMPVTGTWGINLDAVSIQIWWHAAAATIPKNKYYVYEVFDATTNQYLGNLPNVTSKFGFSQDINTGGSQITVNCGVSADTSSLAVDLLTDESGIPITDESLNQLTDEGQTPYTGVGGGAALIRNGNTVKVWEYSYYYPNGKLMFSGKIERHIENYGGDTGDNDVSILIYSDGQDMTNHLAKTTGNYTSDQSQTTQNASYNEFAGGKGGGFNYIGQTWKANQNNLGAISVMLSGTGTVTLNVANAPGYPLSILASVTQNISLGSPTVVQFAMPSYLATTIGNTYFFDIEVSNGNVNIYYDTSTLYANGTMYEISYSGGSYTPGWGSVTGSMYFVTYKSNGATTASFSNQDPSTMLTSVLGAYNGEGGLVTAATGSIQNTGLSLTYGLNTNTVYSAIQGILSIAPSGWYFYVDIGYDIIYFQQASTTADFTLTKGIHISKLAITSSMEYVINACYVIGGPDSGNPGYNIYTYDFDATSIAAYGLQLGVHTDNNISTVATAHAVGSSIVAQNKKEAYLTNVFIPAGTMDTTLLVPGKIIGFNGFGTYVDNLLAQIVHRDYSADGVNLQLGVLPTRTTTSVAQITSGLTALSTIATNTNPASPS